MTREYILREVETERQCQDHLWGGPAHDDRHAPADWLSILVRHLGLAAGDCAEIDPGRYRKQLVRVAAVAVAAAEAFDRRHGVERVAGKHTSGSGW